MRNNRSVVYAPISATGIITYIHIFMVNVITKIALATGKETGIMGR